MIGKPSIQKVISGCCKKQPKYQRLFVARYSDFLYAICMRYMSSRDEARDQLQKSLFKILDKMSSFDINKGKIESWISTIAINTCLTELKKKKIHVLPITEETMNYHQINPEIIDQLDTKVIIEMIQSLPDIYREIFNLIEIEGYKHGQIAKMLDIKESSSRARLARSKELLRNKLVLLKKNESWVNLA